MEYIPAVIIALLVVGAIYLLVRSRKTKQRNRRVGDPGYGGGNDDTNPPTNLR